MDLIRKFLDNEVSAEEFSGEIFRMSMSYDHTEPPWWAEEILFEMAAAGEEYAPEHLWEPGDVTEAELREIAQKTYDELAKMVG